MNLPPNTPAGVRKMHMALAWSWFTFGLLGLADDFGHLGLGVDRSLPVLFFISVYANFTGHLATASVARTEERADDDSDDDN